MFKISQKGAMFGLDARIALAIFGALSVISGAALYSAVKSAKMESYRQNFEELTKASTQYFLDTGEELPFWATSSGRIFSGHLINNIANLSNWKGPYINGTLYGSIIQTNMTKSLNNNNGNPTILFFLHTNSTWSNNSTYQACTIGDADCAEYIAWSPGTSVDAQNELVNIFNNLDNHVDGGDGPLSGTIRFTTVDNGYLLYKGRPRKRLS